MHTSTRVDIDTTKSNIVSKENYRFVSNNDTVVSMFQLEVLSDSDKTSEDFQRLFSSNLHYNPNRHLVPIRSVDEPIEVIAHFDDKGMHPLRFKWQDHFYL